MTTVLKTLAAALALMLMAGVAAADDVMVGDLTIAKAWTRATPPKAPVGGGFVTIVNTGDEADRLVGGVVDFAGHVEVHEMSMDGDVMRMRELEDGLEIPAGEDVVLKPGSFHLMFMDLAEPLKEGEARMVTLTFEKAGEVEVTFHVAAMGAKSMDGMDHGSMDHGKMDHDAPKSE